MNAREHIAEALYHQRNPTTVVRWDHSDWRDSWLASADAVLAILPDLLAERWVYSYVAGELGDDRGWIDEVLAAAAKALTEQGAKS